MSLPAEEARKEIQRSGISEPKLPKLKEDFRELPEDITRINSRQLGQYFHAMTALAVHADYECARADAERCDLEDFVNKRFAYLIRVLDDGDQKWRIEAKAVGDEKYKELHRRLMRARDKHKML